MRQQHVIVEKGGSESCGLHSREYRTWRCALLGAVCLLLCCETSFVGHAGAADADEFEFYAGWTTQDFIKRVYQSYQETRQDESTVTARVPVDSPKIGFQFGDSDVIDRRIWRGEINGASISETRADADRRGRPSATPEQRRRVSRFPLGRYVVAIVVNAHNPIRKLTLDQVRDVFTGKTKDWSELTGGTRKLPIELFGQFTGSTPGMILRLQALKGNAYAMHLRDLRAHPPRQFAGASQVVGAVITEPKGIGFVELAPGETLDRRVRMLAIARDAKTTAALPTPADIATEKYTLTDLQAIYVRDDAPAEMGAFCEFAVGSEASKVLAQTGLWPEYALDRYMAKYRLFLHNRGEGPPIFVHGSASGRDLLGALITRYAAVSEPVQLKYNVVASSDAVSELLANGHLALLDAPIEDAVAKDDALLVRLQKPCAIPLGRMAVGVVVHPDNKILEFLLDDLHEVYEGNLRTWPGTRTVVRAYGPRNTSPLLQLFEEKIGAKQRGVPYDAPGDTVSVISSVASDRGGIGFISLAELAAEEKSVKLMPVLPRGGERAVRMTDGNIPEDYPLVSSYTLYVSHDTDTREVDGRFVKFLTPNRISDTLRKHGLIPPAAEKK